MSWKLWRWQRFQQLVGALGVLLPAGLLLYVLATDGLPWEDFRQDIPIADFDHREIDHVHIAVAIGSCHSQAPPASWPDKWLHTLRINQEMLNLKRVDGTLADATPTLFNASTDTLPSLALTSFEQAALYHSDRILQERRHFLIKAEKRQDRVRRNQLRILLLSAAGAFLVGMTTLLSGKDENAPFKSLTRGAMLPISALALLMPLLSTAISGMVAFDDDGKTALRDLRTVAQLEQLHGRVAEDVTSDPFRCPVVRAAKELDRGMAPAHAARLSLCLLDKMQQTVAWEQRHEQILNDATRSLARAGDLPRPGDAPAPTVVKPTDAKPTDASHDVNPAGPVRNPCKEVFDPASRSAGDQPTGDGRQNPG